MLEAVKMKPFDIVNRLTRIVPTRIVARYFGTPGPSEQVMIPGCESLFYDVLLNLAHLPEVRSGADDRGQELLESSSELIA